MVSLCGLLAKDRAVTRKMLAHPSRISAETYVKVDHGAAHMSWGEGLLCRFGAPFDSKEEASISAASLTNTLTALTIPTELNVLGEFPIRYRTALPYHFTGCPRTVAIPHIK